MRCGCEHYGKAARPRLLAAALRAAGEEAAPLRLRLQEHASGERGQDVRPGRSPSAAADMSGAPTAPPSPTSRSHRHADPLQSSCGRRGFRTFSTFVLFGGQRRGRAAAAERSWGGSGAGGGQRVLLVALLLPGKRRQVVEKTSR